MRGSASFLVVFAMIGLLDSSAQAEMVFNRGLVAVPSSFDPQKAASTDEAGLARDLFEGLVVYGAHGEIRPGIASGWTVAPDQLSWTFTLRKDARWSNGEPVVASDMVFSLRRLIDPANKLKAGANLLPLAGAADILSGKAGPEALGVKAVDDQTVTISLARPTPWLLQILAAPGAVALNARAVAAAGGSFGTAANLVSNGAYVLSGFNARTGKITLSKNPAFHDAAQVQVDAVNEVIFADPAQCLALYATGAMDFCPDVPKDRIPDIASTYGQLYRNVPQMGAYYAVIRTDRQPWNDVRLRQSLGLAFDRVEIAASAWQNQRMAAFSLVPPGTANDENGPGAMIEIAAKPSENRAETKRIYAQTPQGASHRPPAITLAFAPTDADRATATAMAGAWTELMGLKVTLKEAQPAEMADILSGKAEFDVVLAGGPGAYNDPTAYLSFLVTGSAEQNPSRWSNATFDRLMAAAAKEPDLRTRGAMLVQAEKLAMAEMPAIPLAFPAAHLLFSSKVMGWGDNIFALVPAEALTITR